MFLPGSIKFFNGKWILSVVLGFLTAIAYPQDDSVNKALYGIINKSVFGKGAIIMVKNNAVVTDSTPVKKIEHYRKDSLVRIRFRDDRSLSMPKNEFWGLVTDYNERRRFYKNETYVVWRMSAPYIYKNIKQRNENSYYFSESLTSSIHPLLAGEAEQKLRDTTMQRVLNSFVKEHKIGEKPVRVKDHYVSPAEKSQDESVLVLISDIIYIFVSDKYLDRQKRTILHNPQYKSKLPDQSIYR